MNDFIIKHLVLQIPVKEVWQALTDYRKFGEWFGVKLDKSFVENEISVGKMTYPGYEHCKFEVLVQEIQPEHLFSYTWHPYAIDKDRDYSTEPSTLVEFGLDKTHFGTLLLLTEAGFDDIPNDRREEAQRMNDYGWDEQLLNLENYLKN